MDLVTGARPVIVAMRHLTNEKAKITWRCDLPQTSVRSGELIVPGQGLIARRQRRPCLSETAPDVSVEQGTLPPKRRWRSPTICARCCWTGPAPMTPALKGGDDDEIEKGFEPTRNTIARAWQGTVGDDVDRTEPMCLRSRRSWAP